MSLMQRIAGRIASSIHGNMAVRLNRQPLCTFTFDDCPRSSLLEGAGLLEAKKAEATYFVAGSLLNQGTMLHAEDLATLVAKGHEIGCHTYSHVPVCDLSRADLQADCLQNGRTIADLCGVNPMVSFSYPFGRVSMQAKLAIARRFAVARGVREGLNHGLIDLAQLRACSIFHRDYTTARFRQLVSDCKKRSAWLVLYTHDICAEPSEWGCKPEEFREVLDIVADAGIEILTMRAALGRSSFRKPG
jgi:peptidoglycan/xylan/chitin deacetylase (PgdA/CDA1 family)